MKFLIIHAADISDNVIDINTQSNFIHITRNVSKVTKSFKEQLEGSNHFSAAAVINMSKQGEHDQHELDVLPVLIEMPTLV